MSVDKAQSLARLLEIEQLQDNWNGNGANCFSESILSFARKIVMNLLIQPAIFQLHEIAFNLSMKTTWVTIWNWNFLKTSGSKCFLLITQGNL